jgi:diaminopimelate decarboxylase
MPMSEDFKSRLFLTLPALAAHFGTPFHIYDETGIRETARLLTSAFNWSDNFREYYAVKALPNPHILRILHDEGLGFDCSSTPELILSRQVGARAEEIMFTSNNTTKAEFEFALSDGGSILNLDDIKLLDSLPQVPEIICFRYNPGARRSGNAIIGKPAEAKFGLAHEHMISAYRRARDMGVGRFGLHTMLASNERDYTYMVETVRMLLNLAAGIGRELDIQFEFINIGGGLGIPYRPEDAPLDLAALSRDTKALFEQFAVENGYQPRLCMESGRYMTGPHGVLVTTAINRKETYRTYIGVDASMSALMRPGMYGAYHHIDVVKAQSDEAPVTETVDVVGALCENNDKFAIERPLPRVDTGDLLVIQDTGAHGHAMGFNYNGRLRPKELLLCKDGTVRLIRRAETVEDYFATLNFAPQSYPPM